MVKIHKNMENFVKHDDQTCGMAFTWKTQSILYSIFIDVEYEFRIFSMLS